ncbi:MAG: FAD-dependent monooxygenase [Pseudolabrys sp.]|nr:FAD-dependent monooxygenase [Pseudolabrys sp.]
MRQYDILIAGAGLGGLAAASCLMKAGHRVRVFEQAPQLAEIGAGIQISANSMHVLRDLGLEAAIRRVGVHPEAYVFRLHDTGEVLQRFPLAAEHERINGAPYTQMHRADFHDILAAKAREFDLDVVQLNRRVSGFTESATGVELHFEGGGSAKGDLLIGADGLKSAVRRQLFGDAVATYTGDAVWRLTVPIERIPEDLRLEKAMTLFLGPGGHGVFYYLRSGTLLNFVGCVETDDINEESWTVRYPWERLKAEYVGWHPKVQAVLDAADKDKCYRWSLFARPPTRVWSSDRVTLLGDSAHPTLPYLAQGAAMAIEDGAVLTRALAMREDIAAALDLYQRNRVDRTARIVEQSTANRALFHLRSVDAMRAAFAKRNEGADRNAWLYSYNPLTVELT